MGRDDPRIWEKLDSKGWDPLSPVFEKMHTCLLGLDEKVAAQRTTIYVNYKYEDLPFSKVFAVVWIRTIRHLLVALRLPEDTMRPPLEPPPAKFKYPPMNAYFQVNQGQQIPDQFSDWARISFEYRQTLADE